MMQEKRVKGVMSDSLPLDVNPGCSMGELVSMFVQVAKCGNTGRMAVIRDGDSIVGMISRSDLLDILEPSYTKENIKMEIFWQGLFSERWNDIARRKVKEFMRPPVVVDVNDNLMKAAHVMNSKNTRIALVVEDYELVGTISVEDLLGELVDCSPLNSHSAQKDIVNA